MVLSSEHFGFVRSDIRIEDTEWMDVPYVGCMDRSAKAQSSQGSTLSGLATLQTRRRALTSQYASRRMMRRPGASKLVSAAAGCGYSSLQLVPRSDRVDRPSVSCGRRTSSARSDLCPSHWSDDDGEVKLTGLCPVTHYRWLLMLR